MPAATRPPYHYNANWDLIEVDPPAPTQKITMTYDAVSRLASITYANGTSMSYTYDELDRLTKITYDTRS